MTRSADRGGDGRLLQRGGALTGLFTLIEDNLALPFETNVLGVPVILAGVDLTECGIVAICQRDGVRQAIPRLELPVPAHAPGGVESIEAYRHWAG